MASQPSRTRVVRIALLAAAVVLVGMGTGVWLLRRLAPARLEKGVRAWAEARVLALSDSVYRLDMSGITYDPTTKSVTVDSLRLTTDTARNSARSRPLPVVRLGVRGGHVNGVRLRNIFGGGRRTIAIGAIKLDDVDADVVLPKPVEDEAAGRQADTAIVAARPPSPADSTREVNFFEWRRGVSLPEGVPRIRVGSVQIPQVTVVVWPSTRAQGQLRVLPRLSMELDSLVMDARDTATTPIYARDIRLSAEQYRGGWDSLTSLAIQRAEGSFADSVLTVQGVEIRPTTSDEEYRKAGGQARTRMIATLGRFDARGIAWGAIIKNATLAVRAVEIASPKLDLLADHNLSDTSKAEPARMPNQIMREAPLRVMIDSIRVRDGSITYGELEPGKPRPGVVTFDGIEASLLNVSNDPGRMSPERPAVLTASTRLMGDGLLSAVIEVPLLSRDFDLRYRGTLGPMPFTDFNGFAASNTSIRFTKGQVLGVEFEATVTDGKASGRLVPRYRDLAIDFVEKGGGFFTRVKRSLAKLIANRWALRHDNPENNGKGPLASAAINRQRPPAEGFFTFLWFSLRDPIKRVVKP